MVTQASTFSGAPQTGWWEGVGVVVSVCGVWELGFQEPSNMMGHSAYGQVGIPTQSQGPETQCQDHPRTTRHRYEHRYEALKADLLFRPLVLVLQTLICRVWGTSKIT